MSTLARRVLLADKFSVATNLIAAALLGALAWHLGHTELLATVSPPYPTPDSANVVAALLAPFAGWCALVDAIAELASPRAMKTLALEDKIAHLEREVTRLDNENADLRGDLSALPTNR